MSQKLTVVSVAGGSARRSKRRGFGFCLLCVSFAVGSGGCATESRNSKAETMGEWYSSYTGGQLDMGERHVPWYEAYHEPIR